MCVPCGPVPVVSYDVMFFTFWIVAVSASHALALYATPRTAWRAAYVMAARHDRGNAWSASRRAEGARTLVVRGGQGNRAWLYASIVVEVTVAALLAVLSMDPLGMDKWSSASFAPLANQGSEGSREGVDRFAATEPLRHRLDQRLVHNLFQSRHLRRAHLLCL